MTECSECGFRYEDVAIVELAEKLRSFGRRYREQLLSSNTDEVTLGTRPSPGVWSALEYACHVRDVLLIQRDRLVQALIEDNPSFTPMYRDERALLAHYAEESPSDVAAQLAMAADLIATVYAGLSAAQLERPCFYNWPEPAERDVTWLGRHTIHEGEHHLLDLRSALAPTRA